MSEQLLDVMVTDPGDPTRQVTVCGVQVECATWCAVEPGRFVGAASLAAFEATGWPLREFPRARLRFVHESGEPWQGEIVKMSGCSDGTITIEAKTCAPVEHLSHA